MSLCSLWQTKERGRYENGIKANGDDEDAPFFDEYLIAHHILNQSYARPEELIEDVMKTFKLTRQVAVVILDSRSFNSGRWV